MRSWLVRTVLLAAFAIAGCFPDRFVPYPDAATDSGEHPRGGDGGAGADGGSGGAGDGGKGGEGGMGGAGIRSAAATGGSAGAGKGGSSGAGKGGTSGGGDGGSSGAGKGGMSGGGDAGSPGAGKGGMSGGGDAGSPGAGKGGMSGAGVSGGGGAGMAGQPAPCHDLRVVADIEHPSAQDQQGAWEAASETRSDTGVVKQFVCVGTGGPGKAVFGFGCYMPVGMDGLKQTANVRILTAPTSGCLQWRAHMSNLPVPQDAVTLATLQVCRATVPEAPTKDNPSVTSKGTHVGQVSVSAGRAVCKYELYTEVKEVKDTDSYEILVALPR